VSPILVHHEAGQIVGLAPHQPPRWIRGPPRYRALQGAAQPRLVERHPIAAQTPPHDLRAGIVNAAPDEAARAIAALDQLAVVLRRQQRLHLIGEHPRVAGHGAGADVGTNLEEGGSSGHALNCSAKPPGRHAKIARRIARTLFRFPLKSAFRLLVRLIRAKLPSSSLHRVTR